MRRGMCLQILRITSWCLPCQLLLLPREFRANSFLIFTLIYYIYFHIYFSIVYFNFVALIFNLNYISNFASRCSVVVAVSCFCKHCRCCCCCCCAAVDFSYYLSFWWNIRPFLAFLPVFIYLWHGVKYFNLLCLELMRRRYN